MEPDQASHELGRTSSQRQDDGRQDVVPEGNAVPVWESVRAFAEPFDLRPVASWSARHNEGGLPRLIVVSAQPDDETIGAGHLIAQWTRHHGSAIAVTLTGGEGALRGTGQDVRFLAERRISEWRAATAALGIERHIAWHIPQWEVHRHEDEAAAKLAGKLLPGDIIAAPWRFEPQEDQRAAGRIAAAAARQVPSQLLEYLVWAPYELPPTSLADNGYRLARVITGDTAANRRREALKHYVSQVSPLKTTLQPVVPPVLVQHHAEQWLALPDDPTRSDA